MAGLGLGLSLGLGGGGGGGGAPGLDTIVWLGSTLSGPVAGSPAGSTYLNVLEGSDVTREGVTMRSTSPSPSPSDAGGFASTPFWQMSAPAHGVRFAIPAGSWEFAFILTQTFGSNNGTVEIIDDPSGAATVRQSIARAPVGGLLMDTDGTSYTTAGTAVASCLAALTYVPVTVTDLAGGNGVVKFQLTTGLLNVSAIGLRQA